MTRLIGTIKEKILTDCCEKPYRLTPKQKHELEREGFIIYCQECATKLGLTKYIAKKDKIKIYK